MVSILIATYNRDKVLAHTLESLTGLIHPVAVEIILIDNNSCDLTPVVARAFQSNLPLRYLREVQQGKNKALNHGLSVAKGDLIVFTDDDVVVPQDWITKYVSAAEAQPTADYFGGNVRARLPADAPTWAQAACVSFGEIDYGSTSRFVGDREFFLGANFAIRRRVFEGGIRFDGAVGPTKNTTHKGSETSIQIAMAEAGLKGYFVAENEVVHRVDQHPYMFSRRYQMRRRFQEGRGLVYMGWSRPSAQRICGIPKNWLGDWVAHLRALIRSTLLMWESERRFEAQLALAFDSGRLFEHFHRRRDAKPEACARR